MTKPLDIVFVGLSLSSSWGNGHATTYRSLLKGLHALGHSVHFLERDVPWYAKARDLAAPGFCSLSFYKSVRDLAHEHGERLCNADAVIIGSYVPDGAAVIDTIACLAPKRLCFYDIDTPVTVSRLEQGDEKFLERGQLPLFDTYFSFSGGPILEQLVQRHGVRKAVPLHCSVDPDLYTNTGEAPSWDLGYLGTYSPDRQPGLERLLLEPARRLPDRRFVVAGSQYPDLRWPENVERIEHLPPSEHASFYSRQRFTLNLTRSCMIAAGWSPSVRLFEAAACAVPVISDDWPGLDDFFADGEAVVVARQSGDVVEALQELEESRRRRIGLNARRNVMRDHTGLERARELAEALRMIVPREEKWTANAGRTGGRERTAL